MARFRDEIARRMEALGFNRSELARKAGVNATMIRDILDRGQTPSVNNLAKIAAALGTSLGDIYEGGKHDKPLLMVSGVVIGGDVWTELSKHEMLGVSTPIFEADLVTIRIDTDALAPRFMRGDVLSGSKHRALTLTT